ncbi:hypothetical protein RHMOL_Rhmol05G0299300 [Rhododendron molle]|uniref:Uncharacterized protein n=1 Tax=Rhododendron molle TaxID=49168 RepID=A0ACC0NWU2_RHOML|nr:hypothetical protein RHMOL_Rhmol05G0299300 [Rhododendron molle]
MEGSQSTVARATFHLPFEIAIEILSRQFREILNSEWLWLNDPDYNGYMNVKRVSFGFGYHSSANDYKLIRFMDYSTPTTKDNIRADLYVMSTDTWAEISDDKVSVFFKEWGAGGG